MDRLISLSLLFCSCAVFVPAERKHSEQFVYYDPSAAIVQLVGDWNQWGGLAAPSETLDPREGEMEFSGGFWLGTLPDGISRGRYRYAFLVNGSEIVSDPRNPRTAVYSGDTVSLLILD
jgi:1,4-alpha-glucan branching enzyme